MLGEANRGSRGIRQFLDLGTGLPSQGHVHQVVAETDPGAHVVYVDNDSVVVSHARALLVDSDSVTAVQADIRDPHAILAHPDVTGLMARRSRPQRIARSPGPSDRAVAIIPPDQRLRSSARTYRSTGHGREPPGEGRSAEQPRVPGVCVGRTVVDSAGHLDELRVGAIADSAGTIHRRGDRR